MSSRHNRKYGFIYVIAAAGVFGFIQPYIFPSWFPPVLSLFPLTYALHKGLGCQRSIDGWLAGLIYSIYHAMIMYPVSFILYFIPYQLLLILSAYSFFFTVYNRRILGIDSATLPNKLWFKLWLTIFWDSPLLLAWSIVSYFNGQCSAPLISIINDNVCVGALPCSNKNVLTLYGDPYHIRCIINMCNESKGKYNEYKKYKIKYLQLNTLDTVEPSIENVEKGIKCINEFIKWKNEQNDDLGRVFIHCKGGRGRAVTMCICWLISQGINVNDAMAMIKSKRKVASTVVLTYDIVKYFVSKYQK